MVGTARESASGLTSQPVAHLPADEVRADPERREERGFPILPAVTAQVAVDRIDPVRVVIQPVMRGFHL
ncbi:hypothetical protein AB0J63_32655 [Streptosporangium canum]|uniref:hypothetical protein n=1 Tax=Streptosporangium canum TaxID=324952 RepID=UPI003430B06D